MLNIFSTSEGSEEEPRLNHGLGALGPQRVKRLLTPLSSRPDKLMAMTNEEIELGLRSVPAVTVVSGKVIGPNGWVDGFFIDSPETGQVVDSTATIKQIAATLAPQL